MATDWFKMGVGFYRDPALVRAGEAAELLFIRCLSYCAENDTRGRFPKVALPLICPTRPAPRARALVEQNILLEHHDEYEVRSWERWQEHLDALQERRRKDRERKAAERAAARAASNGQSADTSVGQSTGRSAEVPQNVSCSLDGDTEKSKKTSRAPRTKRRATAAPDVFPPTDGMREWIAEHGISSDLAKRETARFLDYHRAKGNTFVDWYAAWRTWMGRVTSDTRAADLTREQALDREMGLT